MLPARIFRRNFQRVRKRQQRKQCFSQTSAKDAVKLQMPPVSTCPRTAPSTLALQGALTLEGKGPGVRCRSQEAKRAAGFLSIKLSADYLGAKELNVRQFHPEV